MALDTSGEVLSEYSILKPISFHLQVKHNLSVKWDHSTRDVAMLGCIETAEVTYYFSVAPELCYDFIAVMLTTLLIK